MIPVGGWLVSPMSISDQIEEALQRLFGDAAGPPGLVITLRRHDEYQMLLDKIDALQRRCDRQQQDITSMSMYAQLYLRALDELREARKLLVASGYDVSFITSLRGK